MFMTVAQRQRKRQTRTKTACQFARDRRSQKRLRNKHLASKMWATVRIASRLLAWRTRARARPGRFQVEREESSRALDGFAERSASFTLRAALSLDASMPYLPGAGLSVTGPSWYTKVAESPQ